MRYRYRETVYDIAVRQTPAVAGESVGTTSVTVDGVARSDGTVPLVDDRAAHQVGVEILSPCVLQRTDAALPLA